MADELAEAVQIIRVAYDGIEIAMKVGSDGIEAMKKVLATILALVMALCLTVPAFAQEVDAGENDIGLHGHEEVDRELHAVGRCAADAPCVHDRYGESGAAHGKFAENGELLGHAAALARRRGDPDAAELCRGFGQTDYAGGVDTVVIRDEDIELVFHYNYFSIILSVVLHISTAEGV